MADQQWLNIAPPVTGALQNTTNKNPLQSAMPAKLPSMDEVIKKAQADYAAAQIRGDKAAMQRAHEAAEAARRVAARIGMQTNISGVNEVNGKSFFDPLAYMWQAAARMPWAAGTPTLAERELAQQQAYQNAQLALDQLKFNTSNDKDLIKQQQEEALSLLMSTSEAYRTGADYLADVQRNKSKLIQMLGVNGYNALVKDAQQMVKENRYGTKFKSGSSSPIMEMLNRIGVNPNNPTSAKVSGNVSQWLSQAIAAAGVGPDWMPYLKWLVQKESSGNPKARNPQPVGKEHATGLLQTLPSTFKSYALSGMGDIYNPVHNAVAAIRYIKSRYGHPSNIPGIFGKTWRGY